MYTAYIKNYRLHISIIITACMIGMLFLGYTRVQKTFGRCTSSWYHRLIQKNRQELLTTFNAQELKITTEDNLCLSALLIERSHAKRVILICHGRWQAKEHLLTLVKLFPTDTLLLIDFRAHGASEGSFISFGYHESKDVKAALNYIHANSRLCALPIVGLGISMGSIALLKAAFEGEHFSALLLDSPFADLPTQIHRLFTRFTGLPGWLSPIGLLVFNSITASSAEVIDARRYIASLTIPVGFVYSQADRLVSQQELYDLYSKARGPKLLWTVPDAKHAYIYKKYPREYARIITHFLDTFVG